LAKGVPKLPDKKTIAIVGNCQAQLLEGVFIAGKPEFNVERLPPVFKMTEADRQNVLKIFEAASYIFLQRVDTNYFLEWVRSSWVKENFKDKVFVWPNLYFDGYFPDVQYIYTSPYGKLQGPLDDYHLRSVFEAYKAGHSMEQASLGITNRDSAQDRFAFNTSLTNLIEREKDVDVKISDFLAKEVKERRAFYTPNHPYNFVVIEMAQRLAQAAGFDSTLEREWPYHLDKIYIPAYRSIMNAESVKFDEKSTYKGVCVEQITDKLISLGGVKEYEPPELVEEFYKVYSVAFKNLRAR